MPSQDLPTTPTKVTRPRRRPGAVAVLALVVALAALGLAAWSAFKPASAEQAPVFTGAQQSDAKSAVCAAVDLVRKGIALNTEAQDDSVPGAIAIAANSRVALLGGGQYLLARLEPATPPQLATDVRDFAGKIMDIGAASTAGALNTDPDQAARLAEVDALNQKLTADCK